MVGPPMKTNRARTTASTMLMLESHWMPLATPETAESDEGEGQDGDDATSRVVPTVSLNQPAMRPLPICRAPRPSEVAEPNRVAKIARMSMALPDATRRRRLRRAAA